MTIKARLDRFSAQIRPTDEHIAEANRQTDYMIGQLKNKTAADGRFTLEKVLKAGSNAKFTSLRQTEENVFDVDLGVYYSGEGATRDSLGTLLQFTQDRLREIYPSKAAEDIKELKSAVRVRFRSGIQLNVDAAPIIRDDSLGLPNGGWLPRVDGWRLTSVTCHNEFVQKRTARSNSVSGPVRFNRLVRMVKWWNNLLGDLTQPSIFCDLVTAAAVEKTGVPGEWQISLRGVFSFLRRHQFRSPIVFSDWYDAGRVSLPADPVIVMDAVNPQNNITKAWTESTRLDYLAAIGDAYDALTEAWSAELDGDEDAAIDAWGVVFGEQFREITEPAEED